MSYIILSVKSTDILVLSQNLSSSILSVPACRRYNNLETRTCTTCNGNTFNRYNQSKLKYIEQMMKRLLIL